MNNFRTRQLIIGVFLMTAMTVQAESVYVIDEINIGLHKESNNTSPIVKLVPSGTELTIIEVRDELIHVQEPGGQRGWIHNKYTVNEVPGKARVEKLEKKNKALLNEITALKTATGTAQGNDGDRKTLEQQLNSERLKVGDLQAQLTDLKAQIANASGSGAMFDEIEQLKQENRQLITQMEASGIEVDLNDSLVDSNTQFIQNWTNLSIILLLIFLIGGSCGAFVLDYLNRRRHGGFRV